MATERPSAEPLPGDWLPVSGKRVYLVESGPKDPGTPAIVLLHGIPTSSYLWRNVQRPLSGKFRVLAPDLLGLGKSEQGAGLDVSLRANAAMVSELLRLKGIERAHVVAHDIGGGVAQILAADHRERVAKLAVMDIVAFKEDWPVPVIKLLSAPVLGDILAVFPSGPNLKFNMRRAIFHKERLAGEVWRNYHVFFKTYAGRAGFARFIRAMDNEDVDDALRRWTGHAKSDPIPTLILWGKHDPFLPPAIAEKLRAIIPGASVELIEDASHFIQEDVPDVIADRLGAFFST
ncbi:MAG: alpha/beta fold hydrolase [Deltaproteobacteria bacterium]|nr:alpha/beta fold hydrolase [Deltaproteobacteria bacterium]